MCDVRLDQDGDEAPELQRSGALPDLRIRISGEG